MGGHTNVGLADFGAALGATFRSFSCGVALGAEVDKDVPAYVGEADGDGAADAAGTAGDQCRWIHALW